MEYKCVMAFHGDLRYVNIVDMPATGTRKTARCRGGGGGALLKVFGGGGRTAN